MLPSIVSREVIDAIRRQLLAQFPSTTRGFLRDGNYEKTHSAIGDLVAEDDSVFKGPYLQFGLPYLSADQNDALPFQVFEHPPYAPYRHQLKAYRRLTGPNPQNTLVATGTGSGKTECFMYPMLEHCALNPGPGIKAIVVYPMNALAQDQARRFAQEIDQREALKGRVRVGLFTGDSEATRRKAMTATSVITCKDTQRNNPPDILLTNYKMLDYLLIRPRDRRLWQYNKAGTLRFLVVDELHTFDGAQGTDLACLIRRLRERLDVADNLACVGTSATVGSDLGALTSYASEVFSAPFEVDGVLQEEREDADRFLPSHALDRWPEPAAVAAFSERDFADAAEHLTEAARLWLPEDKAPDLRSPELATLVALGDALKELEPFHVLLRAHQRVADVRPLVREWANRLRVDERQAALAVDGLIALTSAARNPGGRAWLTVRCQLWLRELRRMVATVTTHPQIRFADDLPADELRLCLPVVHCNECHATGWVGLRKPNAVEIQRELPAIYDAFFNRNPDTRLLYLEGEVPVVPYEGRKLCARCGAINPLGDQGCGHCEAEGDWLVSVVIPHTNKQGTRDGAQVQRFHRDCPFCEADQSLMILGSRAATLSSVAIDRLFNSAYNDDPKLIAFSDSVQDAAHRAGFFESRTYRQVIRAALAAAGSESAKAQGVATLADWIDGFGPFWRKWFADRAGGDEELIATFLAPDLQWLKEWETLQKDNALPAKSDLVFKWLLPRMRWEVLSEFGWRSRLGRTLERSERLVIYPALTDDDRLEDILVTLREQVVELRALSLAELRTFILGLLWRMRVRGAFYDEEMKDYLARSGDWFMLARRLYLPRIGRGTPLPAFLTVQHLSDRFDAVVRGRGRTWYSNWFDKTLAIANPLASSSLSHAMGIVLRGLSKRKDSLLVEHEVKGHSVFTLNPARWFFSTDIAVLVCDQCRSRTEVAESLVEALVGSPCLRSACLGHQQATASRGSALLMSNRAPTRLITAEHSAVLDSELRGSIENSFKSNPGRLWDVNLLSATPTMEMGVDIGDLSSVLLCSVPPAQANYLQRIGRAGRRDGNAFNLAIANGVPHDLYFFAEPLEMMDGTVQPPGVFLKAIAVLERQLIAFCFDQWVQTGIADDAIPAKLGQALNHVEGGVKDRFPRNFLDFVDAERGRISRDFINLFKELDSRGIDRLQVLLYGEHGGQPGITFRISDLLQGKVKQRKHLRDDIEQLKREIERLEKEPQDDARDESIATCKQERFGLMRLIKRINDTDTLNFFTDEGLLPNYAFPEEGVKLNSVIYRRQERAQEGDDPSPFERIEFEIRRPAQTALQELAPFSRFYGNSRQVEVDRLEIRNSEVETWRFCNHCGHAQSVMHADNLDACPKCGSFGWVNADQKMSLLRLREVYANASDRESRIGDDSDDREPVFFARQYHFELHEQNVGEAYRIADPAWPFGFEYLHTATFREVNFGRDGDRGPEIAIGGDSRQRPGFPVCVHCGKVRMWRRRQEDNHMPRCPMRNANQLTQQQPEHLHAHLYLYRELQSEAIRVLLPFAEVAQSPVRLQSLIAALHLGLKKHFHGSVDHLQIMYHSEPVGNTELRHHFLVLMDTVPGGTGYLNDLLREPNAFHRMLQGALQVLEACGCQHDAEKDGCYRCLFAYRESRRLEETSRRSAIETLKGILERWDQLEKLPENESLHHTDVNALFDSELEKLFIEKLGNRKGCTLSPQHINGKPGYVLTVSADGSDRFQRWSIEPQAPLGKAEGVALQSCPDFLLRLLSSDSESLPVAIFLDGYQYHADKMSDDTAKRFAICASGRYRVWSLGWYDIQPKDGDNGGVVSAWFDVPVHAEGQKLYDTISKNTGERGFSQLGAYGQMNAMALLCAYLASPSQMSSDLMMFARSRLMGMIDMEASRAPDQLLQQLGGWMPISWFEQHYQGAVLLGYSVLPGGPLVSAAVSIAHDAVASGALETSGSVCMRLDDSDIEAEGYPLAWRRFWNASNLLQFAPHFLPLSKTGIEKVVYSAIVDAQQAALDSEQEVLSAAWGELMELTYKPEELVVVMKAGCPPPEIGLDLQGADQGVLVTLEWAWAGAKVGLLDGSDEEREAFQAQGWRIFIDTDEGYLQELIACLGGTTER